MSQLDNKKTNKAKKTFFMLLTFSVICAAVTFACIYNTITLRKENLQNISVKQELQNTIITEDKEVREDAFEKIKLTDKYSNNGITTEDRNISYGDIIYQYESNIRRKLEIDYFQISGLKNKSIQDKINKEIENTVLSLRNDDELNNSNVRSISVSAYLSANFSDVISVVITKFVNEVNGEGIEEYKYSYETLNYSLKDGKKIEFKNLFTQDAPIKNIITQSIYDSLAWDYANNEGLLDADMDNLDYSGIEDDIFKFLVKYNKNPNLKFYFNQNTINFIDEANIHEVEMEKFYESIAIYNRYKSSENLYEDESLVKATNYVFSFTDMTDFVVDEGKKTDNLHYRIIKYNANEELSEECKKAEESVQDIIYQRINEYAIIANKNKQSGYVLDIIYGVSEYYGRISYNYSMYFCSMDREYFDTNLEELFAGEARKDKVELWACDYSYINPEDVTFEEERSLYIEDYNNPTETEQIITRADREQMEAEYY